MRLGAHLPLADFGEGTPTATQLCEYAQVAASVGCTTLSANDHLVWGRPWLDGSTALACAASVSGDLTLATSIALPVVRHPAVVAKMLTSLATMTGGRVVGGLGPGSSRADLAAVGIEFDERWARFDEAFALVRSLVRGEPTIPGTYYGSDLTLAPRHVEPPQVWFGSWGSEQRLTAMAGLADGWFASAYNAAPDHYRGVRSRLDEHLRAAGRDPTSFPDAVATTWLYVTERQRDADDLVRDVLAPALKREPESLAHLPIGSAQRCAEALAAYEDAGAREILVWPVRQAVRQLEACANAMSL